jgi:hypothetical protein
MTITPRAATSDDTDDLVALGLRAWEPVHTSMAAVLGPAINLLAYPEWAASQADDIRTACGDPDARTIVAEEDGALIGFATVVVHRNGATVAAPW